MLSISVSYRALAYHDREDPHLFNSLVFNVNNKAEPMQTQNPIIFHSIQSANLLKCCTCQTTPASPVWDYLDFRQVCSLGSTMLKISAHQQRASWPWLSFGSLSFWYLCASGCTLSKQSGVRSNISAAWTSGSVAVLWREMNCARFYGWKKSRSCMLPAPELPGHVSLISNTASWVTFFFLFLSQSEKQFWKKPGFMVEGYL